VFAIRRPIDGIPFLFPPVPTRPDVVTTVLGRISISRGVSSKDVREQ
jgi:hypothetical protein